MLQQVMVGITGSHHQKKKKEEAGLEEEVELLGVAQALVDCQ